MIMKTIGKRCWLAWLTSLFCVMVVTAGNIQRDGLAESRVLKSFYEEYITNILEGRDSANKKLMKEYMVLSLFERIPEMIRNSGADPVLRAQDVNEEMLKSLEVKRLDKPGWYMVSYSWDGSKVTSVPVKVAREGDVVKIKYIVPEDRKLSYGDELIPENK